MKKEDKLDFRARLFFIFLAILPLSVGCMFFIPGIFLLKRMIEGIFIDKRPIEFPFIFMTAFTLSIGIILLLLALKFIRGTIENQSISFPVLTFVSLFFIATATSGVVLGLVFHLMPIDSILVRAIVGGYAFGGYGLWYAFKQKKNEPNTSLDRSQ